MEFYPKYVTMFLSKHVYKFIMLYFIHILSMAVVCEILQKKCIRIISFSDFRSHTSQLFVTPNVLKFLEIIKLNHSF